MLFNYQHGYDILGFEVIWDIYVLLSVAPTMFGSFCVEIIATSAQDYFESKQVGDSLSELKQELEQLHTKHSELNEAIEQKQDDLDAIPNKEELIMIAALKHQGLSIPDIAKKTGLAVGKVKYNLYDSKRINGALERLEQVDG